MTRDEIIQLAKQAGLAGGTVVPSAERVIIAFANLIAAREREACAKLIEDWDSDIADPRECAAAIRARGKS